MADSLLDIWKLRKRAKADAMRGSEKVRDAIKKNLRELISDASIITSDGKKKIKIPMKYLDTYRFKHSHDENEENVGQGNKKNKPGDAIAKDDSGKSDSGQAGDQQGEDIYEEEITIAEIIDLMLQDLGLPWLEQKDNTMEIETEEVKYTGISDFGILSNVDKKKTIYENMKRNAKFGKAQIHKVHPDDLRYKVWEEQKQYHSNAAVYCLMDRSGSMDDDKKYIAKAFFFYLAHFCKTKYTNVDLVFIAHDVYAKVVPEQDFFTIASSGGTVCSSAFQLALDHIKEHHPSSRWCNYVVEFSDGDNFSIDDQKCVDLVNELLGVCTAVGYGEIDVNSFYGYGGSHKISTLHNVFEKNINNERFITSVIKDKNDIYDCLKHFLGAELKSK